ncbi:hypothetical protein [Martelella sp. AD-3]|uniref:hypothetical protein n=1 Tax=Martelella sp. AD-3 TaxID=686597 RepID=UPI0004635F83|nr:hypothetical protein [Martelella sp. AD-3]AMM83986.1 hypothetical protein AZF01_06100 [Martelella sp. AD-3]
MSTHFREQDNYVRITELTPELKRKIEDAVENLLMILDAYDGEADDEDDGSDEPVNGWPNQGQFSNNAMSCDDEREIDNSEYEPWLGWTTSGLAGATYDRDLEINGDEHEPFCGWTEEFDQANVHRTADTGPQEWSYHYGFDQSGVRVATDLLTAKLGRRAANRAAPLLVYQDFVLRRAT